MTPPQKKVKLTPEEEKTSANFDKIVKIQDQVTQLEDELEKEIALLQDKYDKLKKPLFDARRQITATIPEFWAEAIMSHPVLSGMVADKDQEVLKHLIDIDIDSQVTENTKMYKIIFKFSANEFFTNTELWKQIESKIEGEEASTTTTQSGINWKAGKNFVSTTSSQNTKRKRDAVEEDLSESEGLIRMFAEETEHDEDVVSMVIDQIYENPLSIVLEEAGADGSFIEDDE